MNYSSVVSNIKAWMENDGTEFADVIDTIIELAELRIYRDVDLAATHTKTTGTFTSGTATISRPSGLLAVRYMTVTDGDGAEHNIDLKDESLIKAFNQSANGLPRFYCMPNATQIEVAPTPDDTYAYIVGYKYRPTAMSAGNTTTWLGDNAPDLLLYACFLESVQFMKGEPDDLQTWQQNYVASMTSLKKEEELRGREPDDRKQEPHGNN